MDSGPGFEGYQRGEVLGWNLDDFGAGDRGKNQRWGKHGVF
jgi:hypothetical protein